MLTQTSINPSSIKWGLGTPGVLVVESKLAPRKSSTIFGLKNENPMLTGPVILRRKTSEIMSKCHYLIWVKTETISPAFDIQLHSK